MNSSEIVGRLRAIAIAKESTDFAHGRKRPNYGRETEVEWQAASHIEAQEKLLSAVKEAYEAYHAALKNREHGGIAAHRCVDAIGLALSQKDTA